MTKFRSNIKPFVLSEIQLSKSQRLEPELAFSHLERAHILGQSSTIEHIRVHVHMLHWGVQQKNLKEIAGQLFRIIGAATKTVFGFVPAGNTGGANVSPFRSMPVPSDLALIIERSKL